MKWTQKSRIVATILLKHVLAAAPDHYYQMDRSYPPLGLVFCRKNPLNLRPAGKEPRI